VEFNRRGPQTRPHGSTAEAGDEPGGALPVPRLHRGDPADARDAVEHPRSPPRWRARGSGFYIVTTSVAT